MTILEFVRENQDIISVRGLEKKMGISQGLLQKALSEKQNMSKRTRSRLQRVLLVFFLKLGGTRYADKFDYHWRATFHGRSSFGGGPFIAGGATDLPIEEDLYRGLVIVDAGSNSKREIFTFASSLVEAELRFSAEDFIGPASNVEMVLPG